MRYPTAHKDHTRQRIVDTAARLFQEQGIDATGVASVMSAADLTNGAFYAHFASKEALVEAVIAHQLEVKLITFWDVPNDKTALSELVDIYLSPEHRDDFAGGCPSAALLDEIGRRPQTTKKAYTDGLSEFTDSFQKRFSAQGNEQAKSLGLALYGLMIGTLQLSRAVSDKTMSDQILKSGRTAASALLDTARS